MGLGPTESQPSETRDDAHAVDTSPAVADRVETTTCYMCACRCGIRVHLRDGQIRYIDGNPDHPVNKGVLCAKGSAGIMQQNSPARLRKPLRRVGPRGEGPFEEIEWDEALEIATGWLGDIRKTDPRKLAFFTGRDQSQAFTGWWASQFGTPNYAAHGGFCSVNMAAAGLYSIGGSFWEFGEPDWERTCYFLMFGVAEDHDSNPIKGGLATLKERGAKFVSVNPVRTGYSAIADEWVPIRPGTDGLFVMALCHELIASGRVDYDWLARYTNAPWLVMDAPGTARDGLIARNEDGQPLAIDGRTGRPANALRSDIRVRLSGEVKLDDGTGARPVFELLARRCMEPDYAPEAAAEKTGVPAAAIRRIAAELAEAAFEHEITLDQPWTDWAGRRHAKVTGRPVAMHAMRGISAHSNGFHTCRAIHVLQMLLGSIDCPGGFRYKPPFPRPCPPPIRPTGKVGEVRPDAPVPGTPLGFPIWPGDLVVDDGKPLRIDKAYSWEAPLAAHGMMHMVIANAHAGDPYPIDTLFMFMANMSWNSSMNTTRTMEMLTDVDAKTGEYRIPHIIYSDAYASEMVAYADLILPDTTYLERFDCISLLDRPISSAEGPADAIRHPVVKPDRDVRPFQDVLMDLGHRLGFPGLRDADGGPKYPGGYADYMVNHERMPGIGMLAGWRGENGDREGHGAPNPRQIETYAKNGSFWSMKLPPHMQWNRHANGDYLEWAKSMGFVVSAEQVVMQLYCEPLQRFRLAGRGQGYYRPPEELRERIATYFDPLPMWYAPLSHGNDGDGGDYPLHAITQRPMAMYHSWGSQNAWLRQIHGRNAIYLHRDTAAELGIADGDWIWVESTAGRVKGQARPMDGCERHTVWTWNAIAKRKGAWNLDRDAPEATHAVLFNHLIPDFLPQMGDAARLSNSDPITGQAAWFDLRVRVRKAAPGEAGEAAPQFAAVPALPGAPPRPAILRYGEDFHPRKKPLRRWLP